MQMSQLSQISEINIKIPMVKCFKKINVTVEKFPKE